MPFENQDGDCPKQVVDWIAWYPEGLLPPEARGRIESHAAECARCRLEIEMIRDGAEPVVAELPDAEAVFGRVLARIEADHVEPGRPQRRAPARPRRASGIRRHRLAAAAALVITSGLLGALVGPRLLEPSYVQAASASESTGQIDVVFRKDAAFGDVESALHSVGGVIVAGPSAGGKMRVELPRGSDPGQAAEALRSRLGRAAVLVEPALP